MPPITLRLEPVEDPEARYQKLLADLRAGTVTEVPCDDLLFLRIRLGIAEGDLSVADIQVVHASGPVGLSEQGNLVRPPEDMHASRRHALHYRLLRAISGKQGASTLGRDQA